MHVRLLDDPAAFLEATAQLRADDPVRTNVLGSVATGITLGATYEAQAFFVAEADDGTVVGAALWTVPHKLLVGPMPDDAAHAVGRAAAVQAQSTGHAVPGVVGPPGVAEIAAAGVGGTWRTAMAERLLVLHDYLRPSPVAGVARTPGESDLPLLSDWLGAFARESGALVLTDDDAVRGVLPRLRLWEVDGTPVSMAGHAALVRTPGGAVGRVGPVFTPVEHRGHGYGTAVTAVVVELLLADAETVMLFADDANPTSNHVYENLGFVHEDDVVELEPSDSAAS